MKKQKFYLSLVACACAVTVGCTALTTSEPEPTLQYKFQDARLPIEQRVDDLIAQMTLQEKVGQMFDKSPAIKRLGIPEYNWWNEALHGVARAGTATVFPQAIGMAATFDEDLMLQIGTAISDEGRAKHHYFLANGNRSMYTGLTYWSPNINIFRDPRWGRGQETYGEDPLLTTRMAVNFIHGLQGDNDKYLKSVATVKHYAVHSGPEVSRHSDDYAASPKDLAETYLPAFRDTIAETNVASVMCAYNRVNGKPACGSEELIQDKLRGEFGFNGYIVSDCGAIADFYDPKAHHVVDTEAKAAAMALKTGTDLNCGAQFGSAYSYLTQAVEQGLVDEAKVNQALKRLLMARFKLGMFDTPSDVPFSTISMDVVGSDKHQALTQEAAEKSLVLLKNNKVLPLKGSEKIALIGPNANNPAILVANYHGKPVNPVTPKAALEKRLGEEKVLYAPGSSLTGDVYTHYTPVDAQNFFHIDHSGKQQPGLIGEYYPDSHFGRQPVKRQIDPNLDFNWERSPVDGSTEQEFAVKWQGQFKPTRSGEYRFKATNLSFTLDGKGVDGPIQLERGKTYAFTAEASLHHFWHSNVIEPSVQLAWLDNQRDLQQEALQAAKQADVVVFVGGISANLEGEEMALELDGFSHGDRTHIKLPKSQEQLLKKLKETGKPIVYVNMSGSAIALNWQEKNLDAIIQGFYPGESTGTALANLIFGDYSPSGRLPVTFYKSVADLPDFKEYKMANRTYKYYQGEVLYPFGYGLSYADIHYKQLQTQLSSDGSLKLEVSVANQSAMEAEEVVQVYLSMPDAPIATPIRQLVSFKRIKLAPTSSQGVQFSIPAKQLIYIDEQGESQPYHGKLSITVGAGQGIKLAPHQFTQAEITLP